MAFRTINGKKELALNGVVRQSNGDITSRNIAAASRHYHIIIGVNIPHKLEIIAVIVVGLSQNKHGN